MDAGGDAQHLTQGEQADGDDDDRDAVEKLRGPEGETRGAAGPVDADDNESETDAQCGDAAKDGLGYNRRDREEGADSECKVLGRAKHGGQLHEYRSKEDNQDCGDEAAGEGADRCGGQGLRGLSVPGHAVPLEGGGDR